MTKKASFCPKYLNFVLPPLDIRTDYSDLGGFDLKTFSGEHFKGGGNCSFFSFSPVIFCVSGVVPLGMVETKKNFTTKVCPLKGSPENLFRPNPLRSEQSMRISRGGGGRTEFKYFGQKDDFLAIFSPSEQKNVFSLKCPRNPVRHQFYPQKPLRASLLRRFLGRKFIGDL